MKLLSISLIFLMIGKLYAATPMYYWDNQKKLIRARGCGIMAISENQFRFTKYFGEGESKTENLRNFRSVLQSHLVNA